MTTLLEPGAPDDLVDAEGAALQLGVSPSTVRTWASRYPARLPRWGSWVGGGRGRARRRTLYSLADLFELQRDLAAKNPPGNVLT